MPQKEEPEIAIPGTSYHVRLMTDEEAPDVLYIAVQSSNDKNAPDNVLQKLNDIIEARLQDEGLNVSYDLEFERKDNFKYAKIYINSVTWGNWENSDGELDQNIIRKAAAKIVRGSLNELREALQEATAAGNAVEEKKPRRTPAALQPSRSEQPQTTLEEDLQKAILRGFATVLKIDSRIIRWANTFGRDLAKKFLAGPNVAEDDINSTKDPLHVWIHTSPQIETIKNIIPDETPAKKDQAPDSKRKFVIKEILGNVRDVYRARASGESKSRGN